MASATAVINPVTPSAEHNPEPLWRWVHVGVAALAMVLTLPGRTHGLGLFTEPLLNSLSLDRESYAFMNLWATLLGAILCLPCGWLLDRIGTRVVLLFVTTGLGASVIAMSRWTTGTWHWSLSLPLPESMGGTFAVVVVADLFLFLLLTRGLGQSALSVVSLALIGRSTGRRSGPAMGVYAFGTTVGFVVAFVILGAIVGAEPDEWRKPWFGIGLAVLVLGGIGAAFVRNRLLETGVPTESSPGDVEHSFTLKQALLNPTFWTFTLAISFYGLVFAGTSLFNESILAERGFDKSVFVTITAYGVAVGLAANLLVGWLATRWSLAKLMGGTTALLALALISFPAVTTKWGVYAYAYTLAAAGGGMTVCFFAVYRRAFGPARLGSIQGVAQMLTVLFSAVGPMIFASVKVRQGAYSPIFPVAAGIALVLAVLTWLVGMPVRGPNPPHTAR
ncbi:MFS transporter [soil metagenome]